MDKIVNTAVRAVLLITAGCLVVWALVPGWRTVILGLLLGLAGSSLNAFLLRKRVQRVALGAAGMGPSKSGLGLGSRIATVLLVAMIAYRLPEKFNMPAALIGCMVVPFILLAAAYFINKRQS
ncbi:ATP synthase subunit I [Paenibacillus radicis (ex Gao et al. 2016)]|uniref:ATP synthase subunit I n=1 Tax=Paenibacillus radicis (ex Gao et al. 2016) TaxID=1737354 RepID=A0A917HPD7_9BACL|nr:ATP synthase subunit I [Paenibacillus radicis (ex Gao et al. 2016)]GGG85052.1 hypothetical protein GCM10010918_48730 [Paenibacillus radicis (ex Gao et al. 2016)]